MKVRLLHSTPLKIADIAIGKCWDKQNDDDVCNVERIERVANKNKHASTIEHLFYNFEIVGISRALLQELARHRIASLSVKSTRYTLKELKNEEPFGIRTKARASEYLVLTGEDLIDIKSINALEQTRQMIKAGFSNDKVKFCLPEAYKTELVWSINARSLQNFLNLRTSTAAMWEIRELAFKIYENLPEDHKFLFMDYVHINS